MASVEAIGKPTDSGSGGLAPKSGKSMDPCESGTEQTNRGARGNTWRCPDPGCKRENQKSDQACTQCSLPSQSAQQFKKGHRGGRNNRGSRGGGGGRGHYSKFHSREPKALPKGVDPSNPIIQQFQEHARTLDEKNDKHERIVKLSRDITVESKRVIFLLHRITCDDDKAAVLGEAETKLADIRKRLWYFVAAELANEDPFKFFRAYTGGLQEYVEALSFYHYICYDELISWDKVQNELQFQRNVYHPKDKVQSPDPKTDDEVKETKPPVQDDNQETEEAGDSVSVATQEEPVPEPKSDSSGGNPEPKKTSAKETIRVLVPKTEFVLGLADLTGEVMRQAINFIGLGNTQACFDLMEFLHAMYDGFLEVGYRQDSHREMARKINVLNQSLRKVENACYSINVRGSEFPSKRHLADLLLNPPRDHGDPSCSEELDGESPADPFL